MRTQTDPFKNRMGLNSVPKPRFVLILHTTLYRGGGSGFANAAATLEAEKRELFPACTVVRRNVESKSAFLAEIEAIAAAGGEIQEFHFIGHSGVYGIMFGTEKWPEQFSPYEWKTMRIPFTQDARFYFHACRSGRWFSAFIAQTFGVKAYGHFWYTTFSKSPHRFKRPGNPTPGEKMYVISCPGKKSHGALASIYKYTGAPKAYPLLEFAPKEETVDASYDPVAKLYAETFQDIGARNDEWKWLTSNLSISGAASGAPMAGPSSETRLLDIGCGNGALLRKLSEWSGGRMSGSGVDASQGMIEQARIGAKDFPTLEFAKIDGPFLPFPDNSFDRVTSLLSFRYLDWDPILREILRVLKPGGEFLVVDMVAAPVKWNEIPLFLKSKLATYFQWIKRPQFHRSLAKLVQDKRWKKMVQYNPIRAEHEMRWYLESRFPGSRIQVINIGWNSRVLAFRSGPVNAKSVQPMQFP